MRMWITLIVFIALVTALASTISGVGHSTPEVLGQRQAEATTLQTDLAGDADCSGTVDTRDAGAILAFVAGIEPVDCVIVAGNVICRDALDIGDALAVLRHVMGTDLDLPALCPRPGSPIVFAPEISLTCATDSAAPGEEIECSHSATAYYAEPGVSWDFADASSVVARHQASSVGCPPDRVPCIWGKSDIQAISFDSPGLRNISVTGCVQTVCAEASWQVTIESQQ